jgi:hypothetical protein
MKTVELKVADLKPHEKNYRKHPESQIDHIVASIEEHGFYRNIVVAKDNTILAGHGVYLALLKMGAEVVPAFKVNIGPNHAKALKLLTGDNEIARLGFVDESQLTEILQEIDSSDLTELLGTGFSQDVLNVRVNGVGVNSSDEEWAGMPEYSSEDLTPHNRIVVSFENDEDRHAFAKKLGIEVTEKTRAMWYPDKPQDKIEDKRY